MPQRTISVSHLYVHERRKTANRKDIADFDGEGSDLLHNLRGFINGLPDDALVDTERERYLRIIDLVPSGRTLLVTMEMGYYGVRGRVRNVATHDLEHEHDEASASTNDVRMLACAPKGSTGMLVFVERAGQARGGGHVLRAFHEAWRAKWSDDDLMLKIETLVETQEWLDRANLEEVSGVVNGYDWGSDVADAGTPKTMGRLESVLKPDGAHAFLPRFIWEGLRDRNLDAARVLGFPENSEVEELRVRVSADGKQKEFAIERERQPAISYVLSKTGTPGDEELKKFCFPLAKDLLPGVGGEWKTKYQSGNWSTDELNVKLEMAAPPDEQ